MKCLKTIAVVIVFGGAVFAQSNVSPVISMTWDWQDSTFAVDQRIGVQASIDGDRYYGIDTNGSDQRVFFGWKFAKLGIGATGEGETLYSVGATYSAVGGLATEIEYVGTTAEGIDSFIRISLTTTF